jgi:hypothetical protein
MIHADMRLWLPISCIQKKIIVEFQNHLQLMATFSKKAINYAESIEPEKAGILFPWCSPANQDQGCLPLYAKNRISITASTIHYYGSEWIP